MSLWWSFIGRHDIGDNFYLHIVVPDRGAAFRPETIEVIDAATGESVGPFPLSDRPDTSVCPQLAERGIVYWTEGIPASELPPVFQDFITYDPRIFRVTVRESTGQLQLAHLAVIPGVCESTSE